MNNRILNFKSFALRESVASDHKKELLEFLTSGAHKLFKENNPTNINGYEYKIEDVEPVMQVPNNLITVKYPNHFKFFTVTEDPWYSRQDLTEIFVEVNNHKNGFIITTSVYDESWEKLFNETVIEDFEFEFNNVQRFNLYTQEMRERDIKKLYDSIVSILRGMINPIVVLETTGNEVNPYDLRAITYMMKYSDEREVYQKLYDEHKDDFTPEELISTFGDDIDWIHDEELKRQLRLAKRSKKMFGI